MCFFTISAPARRIGSLIRYADDFVVVCATSERAEQAQALAAAMLATVGLRLHPDKTSIRNIRDGNERVRLSRVSSPYGEILEATQSPFPGPLAVGEGDALDPCPSCGTSPTDATPVSIWPSQWDG